MNVNDYYMTRFDRIYVTSDACNSKANQRASSFLPDIPVIAIDTKEDIPDQHLSARTILLTSPRGEVVKSCPCSRGQVYCNYFIVDIYAGCTLGCSYCVMKSYLNFSPLTVYADPGPGIRRIREIASLNTNKMVRVGSGEVGDSLLLDPVFQLSADYISGLADIPNVFFESKTKTSFVSHLLDIPAKGNAVIGFSLNPEEIVSTEEGESAGLEERLYAAKQAAQAGFLLSFHFDPIFSGFDEAYCDLIRRLKDFRGKVAWVSLGMLRFSSSLRERIGTRQYLFAEFTESGDGKYRYLQKQRIRTYRKFIDELKESLDVPVYLCMESPAVWRYTMGSLPKDRPELEPLFTPMAHRS